MMFAFWFCDTFIMYLFLILLCCYSILQLNYSCQLTFRFVYIFKMLPLREICFYKKCRQASKQTVRLNVCLAEQRH